MFISKDISIQIAYIWGQHGS